MLAYLLLGIAALQDANQYRVTGGGNSCCHCSPGRARFLPAANREGSYQVANKGALIQDTMSQNGSRIYDPLSRFTFLPTFVGSNGAGIKAQSFIGYGNTQNGDESVL